MNAIQRNNRPRKFAMNNESVIVGIDRIKRRIKHPYNLSFMQGITTYTRPTGLSDKTAQITRNAVMAGVLHVLLFGMQ